MIIIPNKIYKKSRFADAFPNPPPKKKKNWLLLMPGPGHFSCIWGIFWRWLLGLWWPGLTTIFLGICMAGGSSDLICLPGLAGYSWTNMTVIGNHHIWNPKLEPFCWLTPPKSIFAASLRQSNGHAFRWFPPPLLRGGFKSWSNRSPACRNTLRDVWNKSACRTAGRTCSG